MNWFLAFIATAIGIAEILSWLPRHALIVIAVTMMAIITWALLYKFSIRQKRIDAAAIQKRIDLGY